MSMEQRRNASTGFMCLLPLALVLGGCDTIAQRNQGILAAGMVAASVTPYYLGSFDPAGQLPPTLYRIRVRGQSSMLNQTKFASSWVPAEVVDALTGSAKLDVKSGSVKIERDTDTSFNINDSGRRLMQFGPEGFRTAPKGHRLVILMGASPEKVEQAFSTALGTVALAANGASGNAVDRDALKALLDMGRDKAQLQSLLAAP
jgi:hypothetical protein